MKLHPLVLIAGIAFALSACPAQTPLDPAPPPAPTPPSPPAPPPPAPPSPPPPAPPAPPSPPTADTTPPTIVSVTPNNGSIGVAKDANIVIVFSEAMNEQATELAYQSTDIPSVTFAWSKKDTQLEIDPVTDLEYTNTGKLYSFKLKNTATDLAGNALNAFTSSFTTFRELTRTLASVSSLDGDVRGDGLVDTSGVDLEVGDSGTADNAQYKGFLSFDLSSLETNGLTTSDRITSAELRVFQETGSGSPYTDLRLGGKHMLAAHVNYGPALNAGDFNTPILDDLGEFSADDAVEFKSSPNALESARDDWTNRVGRGSRSQFMFFFARATDGDGVLDVAHLLSSENAPPPELKVKFLVP